MYSIFRAAERPIARLPCVNRPREEGGAGAGARRGIGCARRFLWSPPHGRFLTAATRPCLKNLSPLGILPFIKQDLRTCIQRL